MTPQRVDFSDGERFVPEKQNSYLASKLILTTEFEEAIRIELVLI